MPAKRMILIVFIGITYLFRIRRAVLQLLQCAAELVGARGRLAAAADAVEFADDIVNLLADDEAANTLQVAVASAQEENLLDDVVVVRRRVNEHRAGALCLILYMFHDSMVSHSFHTSFFDCKDTKKV